MSEDTLYRYVYTLIDEEYVNGRTERVRMLLEAGADVNVRVRDREYVSVLDREGVSVLERTRRWVCQSSNSKDWYDRKYRAPEYREVMREMKKYVRRYSV
jgi:ankyrin repeat protein